MDSRGIEPLTRTLQASVAPLVHDRPFSDAEGNRTLGRQGENLAFLPTETTAPSLTVAFERTLSGSHHLLINNAVGRRVVTKPDVYIVIKSSQGERIRTFGPLVPNQMLYQAELHPDSATRKIHLYTKPLLGGCGPKTTNLGLAGYKPTVLYGGSSTFW